MEAIFNAFDLTAVMTFVIASGVLIVAIHLAFKAIDKVRYLLLRSQFEDEFDFQDYLDHLNYDSERVRREYEDSPEENYLYPVFEPSESFTLQDLPFREYDENEEALIFPDFDPDFDFEAESKYDKFAEAYYEYIVFAKNPNDFEQWQFSNDLRGGMPIDEYLQSEENQEFLKRYNAENPSLQESLWLSMSDSDYDYDSDKESRYDKFSEAYFEAQVSAKNPLDSDQWEFATELRGGLSLDEYLESEENQEFLKRYCRENTSGGAV